MSCHSGGVCAITRELTIPTVVGTQVVTEAGAPFEQLFRLQALSGPEFPSASVCKICARMSPFLLALRRAPKIRDLGRFTQINSVRFDRF